MNDNIILGAIGVVCITILGSVYMLVFKQDGTVLVTVCTAIGAIIGGVVGYKYRKDEK